MNRTGPLVTALAIGLVALVASGGCSSGSSQGTTTGSGGTHTGAAGSTGAAGATGGTSASGSGGSSGRGGSTGSGGSAGSAGSSGGAAGSAGGHGAGGAAAGAGGNGPGHDGGATGGGSAGNGGAGGVAPSPAAALDKFRFECPCKPGAGDHLSNGDCNVTPQTDRQTATKTMGGDSGTMYNVTLRVRGLSEPNTYTGGTLDPDNRFYTGGTTTDAGYTSYMMTVADPAQHYFFNYNPTIGHLHFLLDYTVTVKIRGGTTVTFDVDGDGSHPDGVEVDNADQLVVPDVPPAPNWYDGQFIQLDVVSAEPAK